MNDLKKVKRLAKGTDNEIANELSKEIKQDALANAQRFGANSQTKGKNAQGVKNALKKEAEYLD